ncbi:MAG: hypothetical protein IJG64_05825 [Oscillospiraceae bacterium]|nr:hypothetical protein [Oscillospiraceae bacterium]
MLNGMLAITAVTIFAFALHRLTGLRRSVTPFVSIAILINIPMFLGMVGRLNAGVYVSYILSAVAFAAALIRSRKELKTAFRDFFTPGVILFLLASVLMCVFMYTRRPLMTEWDEFSFWGISQKLIKIHGRLYTYYRSSMIGKSTPPTLAVLSYFFQIFNPSFAEWGSFLAYDVSFFAAFSALTSAFEKKEWHLSFAVFLFGFLTPYMFEVYTRIVFLEPVYMTTYADVPLGVYFSGVFAVYFFSRREDSRDIWPLIPLLSFLTLTKDMGLALSAIIVFMVFFDLVFASRDFSFLKVRKLPGKIVAAAVLFIIVMASFFSWSFHMARVMARDPFELGGETNYSMVQLVVVGIQELLGIISPSAKFIEIRREMVDALLHSKISMFGTGVVVIGLITFIFICALIAAEKKVKLRIAVMYVTSMIGFIGYYVFHLFIYVYIFKDNAYGLVSYNRYIYPYYMGWLSFAVFAVCLAIKRPANRIMKDLAQLLVIGFAFCSFALFRFLASPENLFIGVDDRSFAVQKSVHKKTEAIRDALSDDNVLYIYSGGDNSQRWFIYTYDLAENYVVEDFGVDTTGLNEEEAREKYRNNMYERFRQYGVDTVIIDNSSTFFCDTFGDLFDVDMGHIGLDTVAVYHVEYTDDWFRFVLVKEGQVSND